MFLFLRRLFAAIIAPILAAPTCLWTRFHERKICRSGRALNPQEIDDAIQCGVKFPHKVRILTVNVIPNPLSGPFSVLERLSGACISQASAITFFYGIYVIEKHSTHRSLIRHELTHTSQYESLKMHFTFLSKYIYQCITYGYLPAPMEVEARANESVFKKNTVHFS
jgi:hypothetical protein